MVHLESLNESLVGTAKFGAQKLTVLLQQLNAYTTDLLVCSSLLKIANDTH